MLCSKCLKHVAMNHACQEVDLFSVWLDKNLEEAVENFKQSDAYKFDLFYRTQWENTQM